MVFAALSGTVPIASVGVGIPQPSPLTSASKLYKYYLNGNIAAPGVKLSTPPAPLTGQFGVVPVNPTIANPHPISQGVPYQVQGFLANVRGEMLKAAHQSINLPYHKEYPKVSPVSALKEELDADTLNSRIAELERRGFSAEAIQHAVEKIKEKELENILTGTGAVVSKFGNNASINASLARLRGTSTLPTSAPLAAPAVVATPGAPARRGRVIAASLLTHLRGRVPPATPAPPSTPAGVSWAARVSSPVIPSPAGGAGVSSHMPDPIIGRRVKIPAAGAGVSKHIPDPSGSGGVSGRTRAKK